MATPNEYMASGLCEFTIEARLGAHSFGSAVDVGRQQSNSWIAIWPVLHHGKRRTEWVAMRVTAYCRQVMGTSLNLHDHHLPNAYARIAA